MGDTDLSHVRGRRQLVKTRKRSFTFPSKSKGEIDDKPSTDNKNEDRQVDQLSERNIANTLHPKLNKSFQSNRRVLRETRKREYTYTPKKVEERNVSSLPKINAEKIQSSSSELGISRKALHSNNELSKNIGPNHKDSIDRRVTAVQIHNVNDAESKQNKNVDPTEWCNSSQHHNAQISEHYVKKSKKVKNLDSTTDLCNSALSPLVTLKRNLPTQQYDSRIVFNKNANESVSCSDADETCPWTRENEQEGMKDITDLDVILQIVIKTLKKAKKERVEDVALIQQFETKVTSKLKKLMQMNNNEDSSIKEWEKVANALREADAEKDKLEHEVIHTRKLLAEAMKTKETTEEINLFLYEWESEFLG